jgi:hypothetical protein
VTPSGRTEARVIVLLIVFLICAASGVIFYHGGGLEHGFPAAVAVCSLALMGIAASYLVLARR